jgi:hypothetical protein
MGITKLEASGHPALACVRCGEIILLFRPERDWYDLGAAGRPRSFLCRGCGVRLTLADRVVEAPRTLSNSGG